MEKDEKEPNYSKMSASALKKYGSKSKEEGAEVKNFKKSGKAAFSMLEKKAKGE